MSFNPKLLAPTVYDAYKKGKSMWLYTLDAAIQVGYKDVNTLTNIIFYLHHPELNYRPIKSHEKILIAEWLTFKVTAISRLSTNKPKPSEVPKCYDPTDSNYPSNEYIDEDFPPI